LVLKSNLDFGLKKKQIEAARSLSEANRKRQEVYEADSKVAWKDYLRQLSDLRLRVKKAQELVRLQRQKAEAERKRYRMGRSTAFQAITFEQDAAESEISLWNLLAAARKKEAEARLFTR
jgi:outer membrane protein TolC